MKNISEKSKIAVGWLLLVAGLFIIGYSLFSAYQVFKGKEEAPQIFVDRIERNEGINQGQHDPLGLNIEGMMAGILEGMLPPGHISIFFNIAVFTIFIFILITGGFKISILGIKLLFNEKV